MTQYADGGLVNHTALHTFPASPGHFLSVTALNGVSAGDVYTPATGGGMNTSEVPSYGSIGVGLEAGTHNTANTTVTVTIRGLDPWNNDQSEAVTVSSNCAAFPVAAWTEAVWGRVDRVEVTAISGGQATDVLTVGYPLPRCNPQTIVGTEHYNAQGIAGKAAFALAREPRYGLHKQGDAYARLQLDTTDSDTTNAADGDVVVLTDETVTYRWELDDDASTPSGYDALDITGLSTATQIRDAIIAAINAKGGHLTAEVDTDEGSTEGAIRVGGAVGKVFLEIFTWNAGSPTVIADTAFLPQRRIYLNAASVFIGATDPTVQDGEFVEIAEGASTDRFEFGSTVATGSISVAITAANTATTRNTLNTAINGGSATTNFKSYTTTNAEDFVVLVNGAGSATVKLSNFSNNLQYRDGKTTFPRFLPRHFINALNLETHGGVLGVSNGNLSFTAAALTNFGLRRDPLKLVMEFQTGEPSTGSPRQPGWDTSIGGDLDYPNDFFAQNPVGICVLESHTPTIQRQTHDAVVTAPAAIDPAGALSQRAGKARGIEPQHGGVRTVSGGSKGRKGLTK